MLTPYECDQYLQAGKGLSHFDCICAACSILDDMASCLWHCDRGDHSVQYLCGKVCSHILKLHFAYFGMAITMKHLLSAESLVKRPICFVFSTLMRQELNKWCSLEEERQYDAKYQAEQCS